MLSNGELISKIQTLSDILIAVATGGPKIQDVNNEYRAVRQEVSEELAARGLKNQIPFSDLWEWFGRWSGGDFPTWRSRRQYIVELTSQQIDAIEKASSGSGVVMEPTGWAKVDRGVGEIRERLANARNEEQFQAVGLLCREVLISLAQEVYDAQKHPSLDGIRPSSADAKRMLESYISVEIGGGHNKIARAHARAAVDLAVELQHKRTAEFRDAALCVEATTTVINVIAITSGRRDP